MKCPCEECISYAICNSMVKAMNTPDVCQLSIYKNCPDLKVYLNVHEADHNSTYEDSCRINYTRDIFGLDSLPNFYIRKNGGET